MFAVLGLILCDVSGVFERAFESLRTSAPEQKEERAMLLEEWREAERSFGEFGDVAAVQRKMPRRVKRKRPISSEDGTPAGYESSAVFFYFLFSPPSKVFYMSLAFCIHGRESGVLFTVGYQLHLI